MNFTDWQERCFAWAVEAFGETIAKSGVHRNHRFLEEALELVQATGCTKSEALQLIDYVYARPAGDLFQEIGGTLTTLGTLCAAYGIDMDRAAIIELARCWTNIDRIRAKQVSKPVHSPLPGPTEVI